MIGVCVFFRESWLSTTISGRRPRQLPAIDLTDVTGDRRTNVTPGPPDHHPAEVSTLSPLVHRWYTITVGTLSSLVYLPRQYTVIAGTDQEVEPHIITRVFHISSSPFSGNNRKWIPIPTLSPVTACTSELNIITSAGSVR